MVEFNVHKITVCDDKKSDWDIIKEIIDVNNQEDAFYILDIETVITQHKKWLALMPRIIPHFGKNHLIN